MAQKDKKKYDVPKRELCYPPLDAEKSVLKKELLSDPVRPVTISQNMHVGELIKSMAGMYPGTQSVSLRSGFGTAIPGP
jgi:hypothetical protein